MKTTLFAATLLCASLAQAADSDATAASPAPDSPAVASTNSDSRTAETSAPASPSPTITRWADRCTDFTRNSWGFKTPRNFLQWLDVFSDPSIWLEFGRRGMDPQSYVRTLSSMLDPGMPKNYLEWIDPEIYGKWAEAAAEPDFYTAVNAILFDPGRAMRWAMLPTNARAWNLLATAVNPETWGKWLTAPFHPKTQELIKKALDPETALKWAQALADPANYPALKATLVPASGGKRGNPYLAVSGTPWPMPRQQTF